MDEKVKAWVSLISSMMNKTNTTQGSELLIKTAIRKDVLHALISVGGDGLESFRKGNDKKLKLDTPLYKFMSVYSKYLHMGNHENWGMVCDHLVKSNDFESAWNIVWSKLKHTVREHLGESKDTGYAVILNVQTFINVSESKIPSWTVMSDKRILVKEGMDKSDADKLAQSIIDDKIKLAMKSSPTIRESIIGIDVITNKAFKTLEESDDNPKTVEEKNTDDVFFQNMIQKSGKEGPIDESFMDYVLDLRKRSGIKESKFKSRVPSIHDIKDMLYTRTEKKPCMESSQLDRAFIITTAAIQKNPLSEATRVVRAVANKLHNESAAEEIVDHIMERTGLDLYDFSKMVRSSTNESFSKAAHDWVSDRVEQLYPKHIKDKGEAFGRAWNEWENKNESITEDDEVVTTNLTRVGNRYVYRNGDYVVVWNGGKTGPGKAKVSGLQPVNIPWAQNVINNYLRGWSTDRLSGLIEFCNLANNKGFVQALNIIE